MRARLSGAVRLVLTPAALVAVAAAALLPRRKRQLLVWGPVPLPNNRSWSAAMTAAGWQSETLAHDVYSIFRDEPFDITYSDLARWAPARIRPLLAPYAAFCRVLRRAAVLHCSFLGGPLGETPLWRLESMLLRRAGVRVVILPFGGDVAMASRLDPVVRNAIMADYPALAQRETMVTQRVNYWSVHADAIVIGFTTEGVPRWDVPVGNMLVIDTDEWGPSSKQLGGCDGRDGPVRVLHAPNHRAVKGTDFVIEAIDRLRNDGLHIELDLVEGVPHGELRERMRRADILADQFILPGYGLTAVEGMACGLPVMCNIEADAAQARLFRQQSFLGHCPIVATPPEALVDNLRQLVTEPGIRKELGNQGRRYVERFHSFEMAQYLFGSVYARIVDGDDVDLMNLFNPRISDYVRTWSSRRVA